MAIGPSISAERFGPAAMCHRRTVPMISPSASMTSDRPSAGILPSRRRSQVFWNRAGPKQASSSASRASTSWKVSSRIVIMAVASQYVG